MFVRILYGVAAAGLVASFFRDKAKTKMALKKAWKSFENILPQFLSVLVVIGLALAILTPEQISRILGSDSGMVGIAAALVIGSITLIPGFVAFPLAAALLRNGLSLVFSLVVALAMGVIFIAKSFYSSELEFGTGGMPRSEKAISTYIPFCAMIIFT